MGRLSNKTVIITGASSGIGKALAYRYAQEGANLVLVARRYVLMCEIAQDIEQVYKVRAIAIACDVSVESQSKLMISEAIRLFGGIDVLINNAGISMRALFEEVDLSVMKELMDVNFWSCIYCTKYALPEIIKSKGSIIGISSVAGYKGLPARSAYSASKFAMNGFLESLRIEHLKTGVHVMIACPGFTESNIRNMARAKDGSIQGESPIDEKKLMPAEVVADKIIRAYFNKKNQLIIGLQGKATVWTSKVFSNFVDKFIYRFFAKEPDSPLK
jgi:short-subunit dehydrogenase